uniref:Uncharacterized protein n=1 Tax=Romanomermis culicivorax TaxID=13658 RepID=A0A915L1I9_ROMCU
MDRSMTSSDAQGVAKNIVFKEKQSFSLFRDRLFIFASSHFSKAIKLRRYYYICKRTQHFEVNQHE